MKLHVTTFKYMKPSDTQMQQMDDARVAAMDYASYLEEALPDGADKDFIMRELRTVAMWVNVCLTRNFDGEPR